MKLLAIDTATDACSAALLVGNEIAEEFELAGNRHSLLILPMIERLMATAELSPTDLDAIAFGRGPGSFTGLRIAAGVTQGIAYAVDIPVLPLSSLAILAQGIDADHVVPAFDARMGQIYCAAYKRDNDSIMRLFGEEQVITPGALVLADKGPWTGAGSGWDAYAEDIMSANPGSVTAWQADRHPHARDLTVLGEYYYQAGKAVTATEALPVYLRDNVAQKPG